jgi:hypothetical protein
LNPAARSNQSSIFRQLFERRTRRWAARGAHTAAGDAGDRAGTNMRKARGDGIRLAGKPRGIRMRATISTAALCLLMASPAAAVAPDECEQQRALFPKKWNDVSKEKPLFLCWSHGSRRLKVTLGAADNKGRRLMSLVPLKGNQANVKQDTSKDVFRIWLDKDQVQRLQEGKYFATIIRDRESCWIRGAMGDSVFFLDNANPKPDGDASSFYNKAPRLSMFQGDAYDCKAIK